MECNNIWVWLCKENEYMYDVGNSFEALMILALKQERELYKDGVELKRLNQVLLKNPTGCHVQDYFFQLFREFVFLKKPLTYRLQVFETISPACFYGVNEIGRDICFLLESTEYEFTLKRRNWLDVDKPELEFIISHMDYSADLNDFLRHGE